MRLVLVLVLGLAASAPAQAQLFIRAPFVRVQVGPGVAVQAPFVNIYVPPSGPRPYGPIYAPYPGTPVAAPAIIAPPAAPALAAPVNPAPANPAPTPPATDAAPNPSIPEATLPTRVPSLEDFARTFQPKAGSYQVTLLNPVTGQPATVRFTLPDGQAPRVNVHRRQIEFDYGPRRYVRIQFDRDGVEVTSRQ